MKLMKAYYDIKLENPDSIQFVIHNAEVYNLENARVSIILHVTNEEVQT